MKPQIALLALAAAASPAAAQSSGSASTSTNSTRTCDSTVSSSGTCKAFAGMTITGEESLMDIGLALLLKQTEKQCGTPPSEFTAFACQSAVAPCAAGTKSVTSVADFEKVFGSDLNKALGDSNPKICKKTCEEAISYLNKCGLTEASSSTCSKLQTKGCVGQEGLANDPKDGTKSVASAVAASVSVVASLISVVAGLLL